MSFKDYNLDPGLNTTIGDGTYIGPNMARDDVRPAIQQIVADGKELADQVATTLKGDPGGNVMAIGRFSVASGLNIPVGTDAVRTSGHAAIGRGAGDYIYDVSVNGAFVAAHPRASFVSLNGRGFRLDTSRGVTIDQFGAVPDCTAVGVGTVNDAAVDAALAYVAAVSKGGRIDIPWNALGYRVTKRFDITGGAHIRGFGHSQSPVATYPTAPQHIKGSMLVWDANIAGIRLFAYTDNTADAPVVEFEGASFAQLESFVMWSGGGTSITAHGLEPRTLVHAKDLRVEGFAGENLRIDASTLGTGNYGNANKSKFDHCFFYNAGLHGAHLKGTDANGISFDTSEFIGNGGDGVLDETGIGGNLYHNCVFEVNNTSWGAATPQRTQVLVDDAGLSDRAYGSICFTASNVAHKLDHCYNEISGWGMKAHLPVGVQVDGGLMADPASWDATSAPCGLDASTGTMRVAKLKAPQGATVIPLDSIIAFTFDAGASAAGAGAWANLSSVNGFVHGGNGSVNDEAAYNNSGQIVWQIPHGTRNVDLPGGDLLRGGTRVVSSRKTGWAVATGTPTRTTFDTATVTLPQLAERLKALIDDLHSAAGHGLIGT
jgi:hypothetical protein